MVISHVAVGTTVSWILHTLIIVVLVFTGPDSLLIVALMALVARVAWFVVIGSRGEEAGEE